MAATECEWGTVNIMMDCLVESTSSVCVCFFKKESQMDDIAIKGRNLNRCDVINT